MIVNDPIESNQRTIAVELPVRWEGSYRRARMLSYQCER
jgi:hypothetical protein